MLEQAMGLHAGSDAPVNFAQQAGPTYRLFRPAGTMGYYIVEKMY